MKSMVIGAALLGFTAIAAASPPAPPRKVVSLGGITEYALDNGLRVLLFPDPSKPSLTVNVTYLVGSRHEGYGETGMAHLLEHMLFKGTTRLKDVWAELERRGAEFNGTTDYDRTNYYETLSATDENLKWALAMEADRMVHSRVSAEDLAKEFSVVRNEFEIGESEPTEVLAERMLSTAFLWHNYGKSTIGSRADIERVPVESLQAFYRKYYQPDNAVLVVAGKLDPGRTLALVNETFGAVPRPTRRLQPTYTVEPVQDGERTVTLRRRGDVAAVGVVYHGPAGADPDFVAAEAVIDLLIHQPTGRLYKALVDKGLASKLEGQAVPLADPGVLKVMAEVAPGKSPTVVRDQLIATVEALARSQIDPADVERYRRAALKTIRLDLADSQKACIELSEWIAQGDWRLLFVHREAVKNLDAARVQKVARAFLQPSNRTVGMFIPDKAPVRAPAPPTPDVAKLVASYHGTDAESEGEAFEATVANIDKHTERLTLPSGMRLALLPRKTRGGAVTILLGLHAGTEQALKGKRAVVSMVPLMVQRGTRRHTYQQLEDELDTLEAELTVGGIGGPSGVRPGDALFRASTVRKSVPAVLALLGEMVREPSFPKAEFETVKKKRLAALQANLQQPMALALNSLIRRAEPSPKDDVRYRPSLEEDIAQLKAVKLADVVAFHKRFWGAGDGELILVGDFDAEEVKRLAQKEFGAWKAEQPHQRVSLPFRATQAGEEVLVTPDKETAMVGLASSLALRDDDPDYPAMELIDFVLGGGTNSRLMERLRQKEGLSYFVQSQLTADSFDHHGVLFAFAMCAPQNAAKALSSMLEELGALVQKGLSAAELQQAKLAYKAQWETGLAQDEIMIDLLYRSLSTGRSLRYFDDLLAALERLTVGDVNAALTRYVKLDALAKVKAGDLK